MSTTTRGFAPGVPLPPGAHVAGDWHEWKYEYRLIATELREVNTETAVSLWACQLPDGSLLNEPKDHPEICAHRHITYPQDGWCDAFALTADGARQLARALIVAADQLDGWTGTDSA